MALPLKKFMDKLSIGHILHPYETSPCTYYDEAKGISANADVAMNADGDQCDVEIMFLYDDPPPGKAPVRLAMQMRLSPYTAGEWRATELKIDGDNSLQETYDWENKACDVFRRCATDIRQGKIPDFDDMIEQEFYKGTQGGQRGGRGGGKKPNIKPEQMPGMSRGKM